MSNGLKLLLDSARGIYIPRDFVEEFDLTKWKNIDPDDVAILHDPDHPDYWDAWDNVLQYATHTDEQGNKWHLWQDGDLWVFCPALMTHEEYHNLLGFTSVVGSVTRVFQDDGKR